VGAERDHDIQDQEAHDECQTETHQSHLKNQRCSVQDECVIGKFAAVVRVVRSKLGRRAREELPLTLFPIRPPRRR
jgi:hypothetical protein